MEIYIEMCHTSLNAWIQQFSNSFVFILRSFLRAEKSFMGQKPFFFLFCSIQKIVLWNEWQPKIETEFNLP